MTPPPPAWPQASPCLFIFIYNYNPRRGPRFRPRVSLIGWFLFVLKLSFSPWYWHKTEEKSPISWGILKHTGKTFRNSHFLWGSTPETKIQSGFLKLELLGSVSAFFFQFRFLFFRVLVAPPTPQSPCWRQSDLQFDWELRFCLEGETSKSVSQIIPRRFQYCARVSESRIFMSDCISNVRGDK